MFNYNHLYYFYLTAKLGGVVTAAKALRIAQPSLSAQIKTLESELSLALFRKVGRGIGLTPDGEHVFSYCKTMFEASDELSNYLKFSDTKKSYRFRIGVTREIERPFIGDILSTILRNKNAEEQPLLSLMSDQHAVLIDNLRAKEIDALVTNYPVYGPDIKIIASLSMPVIAVVTPSLQKKLDASEKEALSKGIKGKNVGLILPSDRLKIRIETDLCLQKLGIRNRVIFESDILAVVIRAVLEGIGIAFLPTPYIVKELNQGRLVQIGNRSSLWQHSVYIISRDSQTQDPVLNEIKNHLIRLGTKEGT